MIILPELHSAYELYIATTENGQRPEADTGPQNLGVSEESADEDVGETQLAETQSMEAQSAETQSVGTQSEETQSVETQSTETQETQSTSSRKAGWFRRKRKAPVDPLKLSIRFKQTLSQPNVKVHFVGAWCVPRVTLERHAS
jgi:hypothetical protein